MLVSYNENVDISAKVVTEGPFTIENLYETLTYQSNDDQYGAKFSLSKKLYKQDYTFGFDLRYWPSYQGKLRTNSGVYIFTPDTFSFDSLRYSTLTSFTMQ